MRSFSFGITTGRAEVRPCMRCGLPVGHSELIYSVPNAMAGTLWTSHHHEAPCGLPCRVVADPIALERVVHSTRACPECTRLSLAAAGVSP